jgi:hypothetical protein
MTDSDDQAGVYLSREEAERRDRALSNARSRELTGAFANRRVPYAWRSDTDRERVEAFNRLLDAQNRCLDTYRDQQLAIDRLGHVHDEARDREATRQLENKARILELQMRCNRLEGQLEQEQRNTGGMTGREAQNEAEKIRQKVNLDALKVAAEAEAKIQARRLILQKRDALKAQLLREAGGILTPELERELCNIDDLYQAELDRAKF